VYVAVYNFANVYSTYVYELVTSDELVQHLRWLLYMLVYMFASCLPSASNRTDN
jgi:hypothetical protein